MLYSRNSSWNSVNETATTANINARSNLISGTSVAGPMPERIFEHACMPGSKTGMLTGKKRNANNRFFPSEYMSTADSMEPIKAKSMAPRKNTMNNVNRKDNSRFRKSIDDAISENNTMTRVTRP